MDLQAFLDTMSELDCEKRGSYHLTLGGLRDALADAPNDLPVTFDDGRAAGEFASYRGYYTDIAIGAGQCAETVAEWRGKTTVALTTTFEGYKGGDYPASPGKPLWRSEYGETSGFAIIGVAVKDGAFVLLTKYID